MSLCLYSIISESHLTPSSSNSLGSTPFIVFNPSFVVVIDVIVVIVVVIIFADIVVDVVGVDEEFVEMVVKLVAEAVEISAAPRKF